MAAQTVIYFSPSFAVFLVSFLSLGAAHLAAAMRYQERNIAEGKCSLCPKPLARHSVRYCERHLRVARLRHKPKNAKGELPGSVAWLYSDGVNNLRAGTAWQPGTLKALALAREQRRKNQVVDKQGGRG
jgi:hypothetical protein